MGDPNCYNNAYLDNCYTCPNGNSTGVNGEYVSCVVNSSRIANAQIAYLGVGDIADTGQKGWLSRAFSSISPL